jgi:hypothetical protein
MVAGFIGDEKRVISVDAEGTVSERPNALSGPVITLGEDTQALIAYQALKRLDAWRRNVEWFGVLLNLAVLLGDGDHLRGPCRVLRISPTGVDDLSDAVFRAIFRS